MSLINDALKKVSEAERGKPQAQPVDFEMRAMQPAVYEKRPYHLLWISVALLAAAIGVATFMFVKQRRTIVAITPSPVVTKTGPVESKKAVAPVLVAPAKPLVSEVAAPSAAATTNIISTSTPAPAPVGPAFRLKGILYTKNPTALINEASVRVGGEVDGATVTKIEETSVALDYAGKTITLRLAAE